MRTIQGPFQEFLETSLHYFSATDYDTHQGNIKPVLPISKFTRISSFSFASGFTYLSLSMLQAECFDTTGSGYNQTQSLQYGYLPVANAMKVSKNQVDMYLQF